MYRIVSVLDQPSYTLIEELREELARVTGQPFASTNPHVTFHVSEDFRDFEAFTDKMASLARQVSPLTLRTDGIGIWTGDLVTVMLPVIRAPILNDLHEAVWTFAEAHSAHSLHYYSPLRWMPAVPLIQRVSPRVASAAVEYLASRSMSHQIELDNLHIEEWIDNRYINRFSARLSGE